MFFILITLVFVSAFTIYLFSAIPSVYWGDSGELIVSSFTLGVSHSPGYPLFNLISKIFQFLPINNVAFKSNLASVFFSALSISIFSGIIYKLIYLVAPSLPTHTQKVLQTIRGKNLMHSFKIIEENQKEFFSFLIAFTTAMLFSVTTSFWSASISTSVFPLYSLFLNLVFLHIVTHFIIPGAKSRSNSNKFSHNFQYMLLSFILFLSFTHHVLCLFLIVPVLISIFAHKKKGSKLVIIFLALLLTLIYLYIPLSSAREPISDWWDAENPSNFTSLLTFKGYKFTFPKSFYEVQERLNIRQYFKELNIYILFFTILGMFYLIKLSKGRLASAFKPDPSTNLKIVGGNLFWILFIFGLISFIFTSLITYQTPDSLRIPVLFTFLLFSSIGISIFTMRVKRKIFKVLFLGVFILSLPINMLRNSLFFERFNDDAEKFGIESIKDIKPQSILFLGGDQSKNVLEYMQACELKIKNTPLIPLTMIKFPWEQKKLAKRYKINIPQSINISHSKRHEISRSEIFNIDAKSLKLLAEIIKLNYDGGMKDYAQRKEKSAFKRGKYKHFATTFYFNIGGQTLTFPRGYLCYFYPKNVDKETLILNDRNISPFFTRGDTISEKFLSSVYNDRGKAYMLIGEIESCEKEFKTALFIDPSNTDAMSNLGIALASKGEFEESEKLHRTSISIKPNSPELYYNFGQSLYTAKRYLEAIEMWQMATRIAPQSETAAKSFNNIGSIYSGLNRINEAITSFEKAIEINPSYINPYFNLASLYEYNKNYQKAIEWLNKAKIQYPTDVEIREYLIEVYKKAKLLEEAERERLELMNLYNDR